jgi:hypothetical protein
MATTATATRRHVEIHPFDPPVRLPAAAARGRLAAWLATTPGRIAAGFAATLLMALVAFSVSWWGIGSIRHAVQTIGYDTKPSIVAAQKIRATLSDLDATVANDLLTGGNSAAGTSADARADQASLSGLMADAANNVTFKETEWPPIRTIDQSLPLYYEMVGDIRAARTPWLSVHRALGASTFLRSALAPQADALDLANRQPLDAAFERFQKSSLPTALIVVAAGGGLVAVLVGCQVWLARRTRRTFNVPLLLATAVCSLSMLWFTWATFQERAHVYAAKQDAFNSIDALFKAKGLAYAVNADESLWLLDRDPDTRAAYEASFKAGTKAILDIDPDSPLVKDVAATLGKALELEQSGKASEAAKITLRLSGLLGDEIDNITFGVDERKPASEAVLMFLDYVKIDRAIRDLDNKGDHQAAVDLCIGSKEGQSNWAFARFDAAVDAAIKVNEDEFSARVEDAMGILRLMPWVLSLSLAVTVLLASAGLWQRYGEYR